MNGLGRNTKEEKGKKEVFTKETLGVVMVLFSALCLVFLISGGNVFGKPGLWVSQFLLGIFGYFSYPLFIWTGFLGVLFFSGKKTGMPAKYKLLITVATLSLAIFLHLLSMGAGYSSYGEYLSSAYNMGVEGFTSSSAGGFITGLIAYPFYKLTLAGGCVISGIVFAVSCGLFVYDRFFKNKGVKKTEKAESDSERFNGAFVKSEPAESENAESTTEPKAETEEKPQSGTQRLFVAEGDAFAVKSKREMNKSDGEKISLNYGENGLSVGNYGSYTQSYENELQKKIEYIKTPAKLTVENNTPVNSFTTTVSKPIPEIKEETPTVKEQAIPFIEHEETTDSSNKMEEYAKIEEQTFEVPADDTADTDTLTEEKVIPLIEREESEFSTDTQFNGQADEIISESPVIPNIEEEPPVSRITESRRVRDIFGGEETDAQAKADEVKEDGDRFGRRELGSRRFSESGRSRFDFGENREESVEEPKQEEKPVKEQPPINREYFRPPLDLLETYAPPENAPSEDHEGRSEIIKQTLADFRINVEPQGYVQGPTITRYEVMMPAGISVKSVLRYDDDLKMRLSSHDGVRIEAPIPGKNLVGIEVANKNKVTVGLKEILQESASDNKKQGQLMFAIGKDVVGKAILDDLSKGPHYLVAGATGSGKSVCLNIMIVSLIMRYSPEELRLILVDPKGNEFRPYEHIPHLMIDEIITEPKKALAVLSWAHDEMERRYKLLGDCGGVRDIESYNSTIASDTVPKMPRVVIIVDELSNLMESCKKDMETRILAIAQKARAIGIHLVLATQRPSVDVITGVIKANLPSRIALKVTNFADSNTILAEGGAEKLLGHGDMLYKNSGMSECERYQGAWICDREINNVVSYIKEHNKAYFDDDMKEFLEKETKPKQEESTMADGAIEEDDENNELMIKALWLAVNAGTVSISQLQRRFQIGWSRAGGIVDKMETLGYISGNEGSKARRVLLSREEFIEKFGPMSDGF